MIDFTPGQLLENATLMAPVAPWCAPLDNLDLGVVLVAQPWVVGAGLRRADFERQLGALAASLPLGHIYFQRINRAVANLESRGVLLGSGDGRDRRFTLAPEGFGALILNLHVLRSDPTLDGSEFEFKLELVAHWNLTLNRLLTSLPNIAFPPGMRSFFDRIEKLTVLGKPVITSELIQSAFNVMQLITYQRKNVAGLKVQAESRLAETQAQTEFFRTADLSQLALETLGEQATLVKDSPAIQEVVRMFATSGAPQLNARAQIIRYEAYLDYLKRLESVYSSRESNVADLNLFRRRLAGEGA